MARPRILSVGQCGYDSSQIKGYLNRTLQADVVAADSHREALTTLETEKIALVLVNRLGDADGAPGLDLIRAIRDRSDFSRIPVMLVSNYEDAQAQAVALGALPGFGKAELNTERATKRIQAALTASGAGSPGSGPVP